MDNKCCLNNVIYQAKVFKSENDYKIYLGSIKITIKSRYNKHKACISEPFKSKPKHCTELSNHILDLNNNINVYTTKYPIEWKTVESAKTKTKHTNTGVGKLRPAGQLRPAKEKSVAREHVIFLNGMRPAKENFVAREHVNVARRAKIFFSIIDI